MRTHIEDIKRRAPCMSQASDRRNPPRLAIRCIEAFDTDIGPACRMPRMSCGARVGALPRDRLCSGTGPGLAPPTWGKCLA